MSGHEEGLRRLEELALARWALGVLPPEDVPLLATEALTQGCTAMSVAVLAGLRRPTSADILDELPALLAELGLGMPKKREALKTHVDAIAHDIVAGKVTPHDGASAIMVATYLDGADEFWEQLVIFYGLADAYGELSLYREHDSDLDAEVIAAAQSFQAAGGLQLNAPRVSTYQPRTRAPRSTGPPRAWVRRIPDLLRRTWKRYASSSVE